MTNFIEERKKAIEQMVENYHAQVRIVQKTDMTLSDHLKGIGLDDSELQYAYEYNASRTNESKPLDGVTTIQLTRTTKRKLDNIKKSGESYEDVVKMLINSVREDNHA